MRISATIPLDITITSYIPGDPGRISGPPEHCYPPEPPEIEFEVRTANGCELFQSDFDEDVWDDILDTVLSIHEDLVAEARDEARIEAWRDLHESY